MVQTVYIGKDAVGRLADIVSGYSGKNIFVVHGKNSYSKCGAKDVLDSVLAQCGCKVFHYSDFEENPKLEDVEKGEKLLAESYASLIIAIGGGSAIDMAKCLRFFHSYSGDPTGKEFHRMADAIPLIAIPTTAGTGAEATHFAVLYKDKIKYSVEHDDILPDYAIVYPPFTYNNPKYLTACTGFDALAQAIEAFWNVNSTEESDDYARKAIGKLWKQLPELLNCPTDELRDEVSEGAYWAGRAINITKTTAPHAFSYPFTSFYGYPHGHAVALNFPRIASLNINMDNEKADELMRLLGIDSKDNVLITFQKYISTLGLGAREDIKIDPELILSNINLDRLKNNPIAIDKLIAYSILH